MSNVIFGKKGKEVAYWRRARRKYFCHECKKPIEEGGRYIDDRINYVQRGRSGEGYKRWTRHIVCEGCWRAPVS